MGPSFQVQRTCFFKWDEGLHSLVLLEERVSLSADIDASPRLASALRTQSRRLPRILRGLGKLGGGTGHIIQTRRAMSYSPVFSRRQHLTSK